MQIRTYNEDQGKNFGKWSDSLSKFLYFDSTRDILKKVDLPERSGSIGDFGGANGNLKVFLPYSISVDIDAEKKPDIVANILDHDDYYDLVVIRFVLHYLNDYEVIQLFQNINAKNILIIQFVNNDLQGKYSNSKGEFKYFRTQEQLQALFIEGTKEIYSKEYEVTEEFYQNRLGKGNYTSHKEILKAYYV